ncbi:heme ABC transporter ATP-binding protein [Pseudomonas caspiana]|uniref:Hemin ABC transporter ATP-binding protein n=1 Tax=Pseudomonas caspiana TaxID=1451454 RepID=A0A1Y3NW27_9PSED|nr:heme ABC transporter ATP-binding protein [Pseudomonas caspiana]OUM71789.1 hemin ABC transporter ATP-binding protein [Pseudomonas caspiana]
MLSVSGLGLQTGSNWRLRDIDLSLVGGEVLGVLGPNGAGKSSLFGAMSGELSPSTGHVLLEGESLSTWTGRERAQKLTVLPQTSTLEFDFLVNQVVGFGRLPHDSGAQADAEIVEQVLAHCALSHLTERSYTQLSGGERQRVQLARALAQLWPAVPGKTLLLDEPTAALDPRHQHASLQRIRQLAADGVSVALVLHDLNLASRYCDRLLLLAEGRIHALGTPAEVLQPHVLHEVFGLEVLIQEHPVDGYPVVIVR